MKKSEIKDLYNQSNEALRWLKIFVGLLPYTNGDEAKAETTYKAIDIAARLVIIVKTMCDYMIDDGSYDMKDRLQVIKSEAKQIEHDIAEMGYDKERLKIALNCRAIINNIKDMEEWAGNGEEPQPKENFSDLFPEESKVYFDRLIKAGYCDKKYSWIKGTQYQAAQAGYHISTLTWGDIKWKPFEKLWGFSNMAQTFSNNRIQANQDSINEIDNLFLENNHKKDLQKLD